MAGREWEVVGGGDKGGILVREGQDLMSAALPDRLSTGAVLAEEELVGERLRFRLLSGEGPKAGWVSLKLRDKVLVEMRSSTAGSAPNAKPSTLHEAFGEARAYLKAQRAGKPSPEYKGDPRAAELAKLCEQRIAEFVPLGESVPTECLVELGELHFRAGAPLEAAVVFQQATMADSDVESSAELRRLAHIGIAAAAQSAEDLRLPGAPSAEDAAAAMAAAKALHRKTFGSLADANVDPPRDMRPDGAASLALVLLHGNGGNGLDLRQAGLKLGAAVGEPCRLVLPKGLYTAMNLVGHPGSSWRDERSDRRDPFRWDSVLRALGQLDTVLDTIEADGVPPERIIIGGFSQGSFFATLVALTRAPRLGGLLCLGGSVGGRVAAFLRTMTGPKGSPSASELPAFLGHGAEDRTVPLPMGMAAVQELKALGLKNAEFQAYPGVGHEVPEPMLVDMGAAVRRWLKLGA